MADNEFEKQIHNLFDKLDAERKAAQEVASQLQRAREQRYRQLVERHGDHGSWG